MPSFFRSFKDLTDENLWTYSEMSSISVSIPPHVGSAPESPPDKSVPNLPANEVAGYRQSTNQEDDVGKSLLPISLDDREKSECPEI